MLDLMIDIETISTRKSDSPVVAIGAVRFDVLTGETFETFFAHISRESCKEAGLIENPSTLEWWSEQSPEAQKVLQGGNDLKEELTRFNKWVHTFKKGDMKLSPQHLRPWGNSSDFDLSILQTAMEKVDLDWPFHFWHHKDVRTVMSFIPRGVFKKWKIDNTRPGTYHDAVDDCKYQIKFLHWAFKTLGVKEYR